MLASKFRFGDNIMLFAVLITGFAIISIVAFGVAYGRVRSSRGLLIVALGLAVAALGLAFVPGIIERVPLRTRNPNVIPAEVVGDIRRTLLIPALIAIVTQWVLVRRGWLRAHGQAGDQGKPWPWITTVVAAIVFLNPLGLVMLSSAIEQSPTDWLARSWLGLSIMLGTALLVMGAIERHLRHRKAARRP